MKIVHPDDRIEIVPFHEADKIEEQFLNYLKEGF